MHCLYEILLLSPSKLWAWRRRPCQAWSPLPRHRCMRRRIAVCRRALPVPPRKKVGISKLRSCGLEGRTHRDGFAELAGLFETFGRDVRVNKKSRMHTDKLGWTYRYVVWKMKTRTGEVGPGQVQGRQEIERLREQQDNVTGGIWYGKGKSAGVSTCIKNSPGWLETRLDDLPMWSRRGA